MKKLQDRVTKTKDQVSRCRDNYEAALHDLNNYNAKYMEDMTEEELDLCEDVVSVRSFSSQNSSGTTSKEFQVRDIIQSSTSTGGSSSSVLPKSRIVPRNPVSTSIPLKVYAR